MSKNSNACNVCRLLCIGIRLLLFNQRFKKFMCQVWMRSAMPRSLYKRKMLMTIGIIHSSHGKRSNLLREKVGIVRSFNAQWSFPNMDHVVLMLNLAPLK